MALVLEVVEVRGGVVGSIESRVSDEILAADMDDVEIDAPDSDDDAEAIEACALLAMPRFMLGRKRERERERERWVASYGTLIAGWGSE